MVNQKLNCYNSAGAYEPNENIFTAPEAPYGDIAVPSAIDTVNDQDWCLVSIPNTLNYRKRSDDMLVNSTVNNTGGTVSLGYQLVKKGRINKKGIEVADLEIEPAEAEIVKLIFEKTIKEGYGSHRVATFLNYQALRTHSGSKFQSMTINRILRNKLYLGYVVTKAATSKHMPELQIID